MQKFKEENKEIRRLTVIFGALLIGTVILFGGVAYAFFVTEKNQSGISSLKSSCFNIAFTDKNSINLTGAYSIDDEKGQTLEPYTFTIKNTCDIEAAYSVLINTKAGSFSSDHINFSLNGGNASKLSSKSENIENIPSGYDKSYIIQKGTLKKGESATYDVRLWINAETEYEDVQGMTWEGEVRVVNSVAELEPPTLLGYYNKVTKKTTTPEFANVATTDETADGLYGMVDDSGEMSYYFRGAVENNYVKFGKNKIGNNMYWRIIRFNGDGTVRMQYDGTQACNNGKACAESSVLRTIVWNTEYDDAKYAGYMFGGGQGENSNSKDQAQTNETPSEIKTAVENWYKENIYDTGYHNYIADEIFCNDRSTPGQAVTNWTIDTGLGYGMEITGYGAVSRFMIGNNSEFLWTKEVPTPQFTCPQKNDKFTATTEAGGNGKLSYPVGLITADEVVSAGSGKFGTTNKSYYLYKGQQYWTFSPYNFQKSGASEYTVGWNGDLDHTFVHYYGDVSPVINIKTEYLDQFVGDGTAQNPWHLEE